MHFKIMFIIHPRKSITIQNVSIDVMYLYIYMCVCVITSCSSHDVCHGSAKICSKQTHPVGFPSVFPWFSVNTMVFTSRVSLRPNAFPSDPGVGNP